MAVSGSVNFSVDRDAIITEALEQIGAIEINGTPSTADLASCANTLNMMIKNWQADGVNLFLRQKTFLFLTKDVNEYLLGSTAQYSTAINKTTLKVSASATDTTIDLTSTTNSADNSIYILQLDDGTNEVLVQNGAVAGDTMTFDSPAGGLTSAATAGNTIYHYKTTETADRPMKILEGVRRDKNDLDIPLNSLALEEYVALSDKITDGSPINYYFNPEKTLSRFTIWPEVATITDYIVLWVQRTVNDVDAATDDLDYPQEWFLPLALGLAIQVASKYGTDPQTIRQIETRFQQAYYMAYGYDVEDDIYFEPDFQGR